MKDGNVGLKSPYMKRTIFDILEAPRLCGVTEHSLKIKEELKIYLKQIAKKNQDPVVQIPHI